MYHKTTLSNGLRVMVVDMPQMESVALGLWIGAGGRFENKTNSGISHFLEHMVFKGTKERSTRDIKESIEGIGGTLNGFTDEEATCYLVKVPKRHLGLGLDVLSDMALNPRIDKHDVDKERGVILEEIKMYRDRPDHFVHQLLCETLWPDHPLGLPLVGTEKTLARLNRSSLADYRAHYYTPENIVVCACGQIDTGWFLDQVKARFSAQVRKPSVHYKKFALKQKKGHLACSPRETEQTHLNIGFHSISRSDPDKYTSSLLHIILGGNMSSRLFNEVRENKGLAYEISTGIKHYSDTGVFYISAGVDHRKLGKAIEVIMKELRKIRKLRVKADEFQRAKDFFKGQLTMALEDTLTRMIWVGEKLIVKDINYNIDEVIDSVDVVTPDMVTELARKIFRDNNMNAAVVGPLKKNEQHSIRGRLRL